MYCQQTPAASTFVAFMPSAAITNFVDASAAFSVCCHNRHHLMATVSAADVIAAAASVAANRLLQLVAMKCITQCARLLCH